MRNRLLNILLLAALCCVAAAPTSASAASIGSALHYRNWSPYVDPVQGEPDATVSDITVEPDAFSPNGDRTSDTLSMAFTLTKAVDLQVVVANAYGREVRTLASGQYQAGATTLTWNGKNTAGDIVGDGLYQITVEATSGNDTYSESGVVAVDTAAPVISLTKTNLVLPASARSRARGMTQIPLNLRISESAVLGVSLVGRNTRGVFHRDAGKRKLGISTRAALIKRALRDGSEYVKVRITATDKAGNTTSRLKTIHVTAHEDVPSYPFDPGPIDTPGGSSGIHWPLQGPITSGFGVRWGRMHEGIDIGVPSGRPIGAAAAGRVTFSGWMGGYGNAIIIDHGSLTTLYGHQSRRKARVGQHVNRGEIIGYVGSTGHSTGPHLHFEVRVGSSPRNPLKYLP
jgi:murein DD-endopeptidase MepM/ murein hydrolase activator NlpD